MEISDEGQSWEKAVGDVNSVFRVLMKKPYWKDLFDEANVGDLRGLKVLNKQFDISLSFLQNDEPGFHDDYLVGEEGDFYFFLREDNKVFISARGLERLTSVSGRGNISRALQFFRKT